MPGILWKKGHRELRESEMEVARGGFAEDALGKGRRSLGSGGTDGPEGDVELGWRDRDEEVRRLAEALVEFEGGGVAGCQTLGEGAASGVREQLLGGPEGDGRSSGARALEGDFAEVKIF